MFTQLYTKNRCFRLLALLTHPFIIVTQLMNNILIIDCSLSLASYVTCLSPRFIDYAKLFLVNSIICIPIKRVINLGKHTGYLHLHAYLLYNKYVPSVHKISASTLDFVICEEISKLDKVNIIQGQRRQLYGTVVATCKIHFYSFT